MCLPGIKGLAIHADHLYMDLISTILFSPFGLATIGLLACVVMILSWKSRQSDRMIVTYSALGFQKLNRAQLSNRMDRKQFSLLKNGWLEFFIHSKAFVRESGNESHIQFLRTAHGDCGKYNRFSTVSLFSLEHNIASFTLKPALVWDIYLTGKPENMVNLPDEEEFSEAYELTSTDVKSVLSLFTPSVCKTLLENQGLRIESTGTELLIFNQGSCIHAPELVETFVHDAEKWKNLLTSSDCIDDASDAVNLAA